MTIENEDQELNVPPVETEQEQEQEQTPPADAPGEGEGDDENEVVITFGDEPAPPPSEEPAQSTPAWVKELRKSQRDLQRENRELRSKLQAPAPADNAPTLGAKPTLEAMEWDTDKYDVALEKWYTDKGKVEAHAATQKQEQSKQQEAWQAKLTSYQTNKAALKAPDFEEAEHAATEIFSVTQQGVLLQGAENSAQLVYALGKNPAKAKELAAITDPVRFAWKAAQLEKEMKMTTTPRKTPPPPDRPLKGSGPVGGSSDATLERLRADAERTGDLSKVVAYKRDMKSRQK